jgi:hypothetical protein
MKRIGYDSDSGRYFYRDHNGAVWQGAEGAEFSEMTKGVFVFVCFSLWGGH